MLEQLLASIGATSNYEREAVAYQLFAYCTEQKLLSKEAQLQIVTTMLAEQYLLKNIQKVYSDDVFTRSSSALWLTQLVKSADDVLTPALYEQLTKQSVDALRLERDTRGFIDEQTGWADAIGVKTELCLALLQHPLFEIRHTSLYLQAIAGVLWNEQAFTNNEDERFIKIIMTLIHKGIEEALLVEWVEQLFDRLEYFAMERGYTQKWFIARTNLLQLMKTQYFHLKFSHQYEQLRAVTSIQIQQWLKLS